MNVALQTQAVLLLTTYFSKPVEGSPRPLSPTEWGRFALWLKQQSVAPEALLSEDPGLVLARWEDKSVTLDRIRYLVARTGALGLALEKWQRAGLWVMTRSDADYPSPLKRRLGTDSPPILFGCGNRKLLGGQGIAVVGARNATQSDLAFATHLGDIAAAQGFSIVSGGARGIDEAAMLGALDCEGTVVGVLAEGLLRSAISTKYRNGLMARNLVLVSPFNPEAGFDVGNAMGRNKYIYCLSDAAIVVSANKEKGGTWNGAIEDLNRRWVPLWVRPNTPSLGNADLVARGARWLPDGNLDLRLLLASGNGAGSSEPANGLFDGKELPSDSNLSPSGIPAPQHVPQEVGDDAPREMKPGGNTDESLGRSAEAVRTDSFYGLFLNRLRALTTTTPATVEHLLEQMDVCKAQLQQWLKQAVDDGQVKKLRKPVRYQWQSQQPEQRSIFDPD